MIRTLCMLAPECLEFLVLVLVTAIWTVSLRMTGTPLKREGVLKQMWS